VPPFDFVTGHPMLDRAPCFADCFSKDQDGVSAVLRLAEGAGCPATAAAEYSKAKRKADVYTTFTTELQPLSTSGLSPE